VIYCAHRYPEGHKCSSTADEHVHRPSNECNNGHGDRHHEFVPPQPHEHVFDRCMCGAKVPA
jgi:hypothetical protein